MNRLRKYFRAVIHWLNTPMEMKPQKPCCGCHGKGPHIHRQTIDEFCGNSPGMFGKHRREKEKLEQFIPLNKRRLTNTKTLLR